MRTQALTLEQWRQRYTLSRRELAKRAEVSHSTIWRIEKRRHIPIAATRRALAQALGGLEQCAIAWPARRAVP
jgi:transcriptional regulator with XRE-family HTH domain